MLRLKFIVVFLFFCLTTLYPFKGVRVRDNNQQAANPIEQDAYLYLTGDNLYYKTVGQDEILSIEYVTENSSLNSSLIFHGDLYIGTGPLGHSEVSSPFLDFSGVTSGTLPNNATQLTLLHHNINTNTNYKFRILNKNVNLHKRFYELITIPFFEAFQKDTNNNVSYVPILLDAETIELSGFRFEKLGKKIAVDFGSPKTIGNEDNSLRMKNVTINADFLHMSADLRSELKLVSYNETVVNLTTQFPSIFEAKLSEYDHALIQIQLEGGAANHMLEVSSNTVAKVLKASAVVNTSGQASLFFVDNSEFDTSYRLGLLDNAEYKIFPGTSLVKVLCQYYNLE